MSKKKYSATGRLLREPALQNTPIRTRAAEEIDAAFQRCNHCCGDCTCPGTPLLDVNERRGCAGGTCTCPPGLSR